MAYATEQELEAYVSDSGVAIQGDAESLLERASRDVDRVRGAPGEPLDLEELTEAQVEALSRATCAAAEFRLAIGEAELIGDDDYLPSELTVLRRAGRQAPKIAEELAGTGLIVYSGTASTAIL